jgi:hypothetical protein
MLKDILKRLSDKEAEAAINPEDVDPRVRAGVEAIVRNAKVDLVAIEKEYKEAVMNNVVLIGVYGDYSKEFVNIAEGMGALAVNFTEIVETLSNNLLSAQLGNVYTSNVHFALLGELSRIRLKYDIVSLPTPIINNYNDNVYDQPIEVAVRRLLEKNYGSSLQSAVTRREIGRKALEARFSGKKLPVMVYNLLERVDTRFLPDPSADIVSNSVPNETVVKKKLTEVKNLLNKSQNNGQSAQTDEELEDEQ